MTGTLYVVANTPRSQFVEAIARRNGADLQYEGLKTDKFKATFPLNKRPVLDFGNGETLTETLAIAYYYGGETPYFGEGKKARAKVMSWLSFVCSDMVEGMVKLLAARGDADKTNEVGPITIRNLKYVDNALAGKNNLVGDSETAPDLFLKYFLDFIFANFPNVCGNIEDYPNLSKFSVMMEQSVKN